MLTNSSAICRCFSHSVLQCLFAGSENDIKQQISKENEKSQKMEYGMSVGRHEARVTCKNKRDGKQLASQQLLAKMHPYLHSWGAILRQVYKENRKTGIKIKIELILICTLICNMDPTGISY